MQALSLLAHNLWEAGQALIPLLALFFGFQVLILRLPSEVVRRVTMGTALAVVGLGIFLLGVKIGFMPAGRELGEALGTLRHRWLLLPVGLVLGFATILAEPAVRVLGIEIERASGGSIRAPLVLYSMAVGVGLAAAIGLLRAAIGFSLGWILVPGYLLVLAAMRLTSRSLVGVALDSGAVATGPMTVTFLVAVGVGVASGAGGDPVADGLGLVALIAVMPILSVMTLGILYRRKGGLDDGNAGP